MGGGRAGLHREEVRVMAEVWVQCNAEDTKEATHRASGEVPPTTPGKRSSSMRRNRKWLGSGREKGKAPLVDLTGNEEDTNNVT
jgi:hypothetical protein